MLGRPRSKLAALGLVAASLAAFANPPSSAASAVSLASSAVPVGDNGLVSGASAARRTSELRSFTVAATGDVLTEAAVLNAGQRFAKGSLARYDFGPLFDPVTSMLSSAQLAICHMEIPIGDPGAGVGVFGRSPYGGNLLQAPYEIAVSLKAAGYDRCSTSSNHSNDLGVTGIDSTLNAFDSVGIGHAGTARTPEEAGPKIILVNGVSVAHLAYTRYSNTDRPRDAWRLNFAANADQVIKDVQTARALGAEVVIVSVHISLELLRAPSGRDRAFIADITTGAKIDLVIEHGPHVIQPIEKVNGTWVYWSVGNFISGMGLPGATRYGLPTLDGLMAWARFDEVSAGNFEVTASSVLICNEQFGRVVYPALVTLSDLALDADLRRQLQGCVARTTAVLSDFL